MTSPEGEIPSEEVIVNPFEARVAQYLENYSPRTTILSDLSERAGTFEDNNDFSQQLETAADTIKDRLAYIFAQIEIMIIQAKRYSLSRDMASAVSCLDDAEMLANNVSSEGENFQQIHSELLQIL